MKLSTMLAALVKIEEGYDAKLSDEGVTPAEARQWRLRQLRRLQERAAGEEGDAEPTAQAGPSEGKQALPAIAFVGDAQAKGTGDLVTPRQLGIINALARSKGVDADAVSVTLLRTDTLSLTQQAADSLIGYLKGLQMPGVKSA